MCAHKADHACVGVSAWVCHDDIATPLHKRHVLHLCVVVCGCVSQKAVQAEQHLLWTQLNLEGTNSAAGWNRPRPWWNYCCATPVPTRVTVSTGTRTLSGPPCSSLSGSSTARTCRAAAGHRDDNGNMSARHQRMQADVCIVGCGCCHCWFGRENGSSWLCLFAAASAWLGDRKRGPECNFSGTRNVPLRSKQQECKRIRPQHVITAAAACG